MMKPPKILLPILLVCAALALTLRLSVKPTTAQTSVKPISNDRFNRMADPYARVDAYVEEQMQRLNIPGVSVAIVEGDQVVHLRGFGQARPGGEAPTPQTPFFIGSLAKSFTAVAVMQLVEAGKIDLDAPIQRYLPWFRVADPDASAQITVRHLLNQTSGLSTVSGWIPLANTDNRPGATERLVRSMATIKLNRPAGSAYEYSNANFDVLGLIIETVSGESYADYIQNHIFNPLEMRHSYASPAIAKQEGLAVGHIFWFWSPVAAHTLPVPSGSLSSGQLISSAEDMAHYLIAHLNGGRFGGAQILSSPGIDELHRGAAEVTEMGISAGQYAMGWFVSDNSQVKTIWHTGNVPDFSAYMAILSGQKKGLVLLFNADHFMMEPVQVEFGMGAASILAGQTPEPGPLGLSFIRLVPWMMRALLLVPLLQILGVTATLRRLRHWRQNPQHRPGQARLWGLHILLPLIPNLSLASVPAWLFASKMFGFMRLYAPDFTWVALICGGFAGVWAVLRTGLTLRTLKQPSASLTPRMAKQQARVAGD